ETDAALTKTIKRGLAGVVLGTSLQGLSPYIPNVIGHAYPRDVNREILGPKTVKGMGAALAINGAKDLFFATKEKYSRSWRSWNDLKKGAVDLGVSTTIYISSYYLPGFLSDPYIELGGQGAALMLSSFLALRGLKYVVGGLEEAFVNADLMQIYTTTKSRVLSCFKKVKAR